MSNRQWYYFGCYREAGHYVWEEGMLKRYSIQNLPNLGCFDGMLCPYPEESNLYVAALNRLGGIGYTALAFWDRTIDSRGKCNSIFFAPSLSLTAPEIMEEARNRFPQVFARYDAAGIEIKLMPTPSPAKEPRK